MSTLQEKIAAARAEGYTDTEIYNGLQPKIAAAVAEGYARKDVLGFLGLAPVPGKYGVQFERAAKQYGLDPLMLYSVAQVESGGRPDAVGEGVVVAGPRAGGNVHNARGIMQLMPDTAKALGVKDPTNPDEAIPAAAKLLRQNLDRYGGDVEKALLSYHGGYDESGWGKRTRAYPAKVYREWQGAGGNTPKLQSPQAAVTQSAQEGETDWNWFENLANSYLQGFGLEAKALGQTARYAYDLWKEGRENKALVFDKNGQLSPQSGKLGPIEALKAAAEYTGAFTDYNAASRARFAEDNPITAATTDVIGSTVGQMPLLAASGLPALSAAANSVANPFLRTGARTATGALEGAFSGILGSKLTDNNILDDLSMGGVVGGVMRGGVAPAATSAWRGTFGTGNINPTVARTALDMRNAGAPVSIGQVPGAGWLPRASDRAFNGPATTGPEFLRTLSRTIGEDTSEITQDTIRAAKDRLGPQLGSLAAPYTIPSNDITLANQLTAIRTAVLNAIDVTPSEAKKFDRLIKTIETELVTGGMSGESYRAMVKADSTLNNAMDSSKSDIAKNAMALRSALEEAFARVMPPAERRAYLDARLAYRNTILLQGAVDDATGTVDIPKLARTIARSYGDRPDIAGDFGALAQGQNMLLQEGKANPMPLVRTALKAGAGAGALAMGSGYALVHYAPESIILHALADPKLLMTVGAAGVGASALAAGSNAIYRGLTNELLKKAAGQPQGWGPAGLALRLQPGFGAAAMPAAVSIANRFSDNEPLRLDITKPEGKPNDLGAR